MGLSRSDVFVAYHLGGHRHWNAAIHHRLDKETAKLLGLDRSAYGRIAGFVEDEP